MKLVDALVQALISLDVRYVFGVSGANIEHLHDAIHRLGRGKLHSVMAKSEDGAAFMADCRARVHRTLGVCGSTSGGGMMNLIAGIAESYSESVPILALVGQPPKSLEGMGAFQDSSGIGRTVDSIKLWKAVAKYVAKVSDPNAFWYHLTKAIKLALSGRYGPVVLLFPRDVFEEQVTTCPENWAESLRNFILPSDISIDKVRLLFEIISSANKPVLILGQGVQRCSMPEAVVKFAQHSRIPVITTISGRSLYPNDDPLYLGTLGVAGHPSAHNYIISQADLIIAVGTGFSAMTRHPLGHILNDKKIVLVNLEIDEILRFISPIHVLEADAGAVFKCLLLLLQENPFKFIDPQDYVLQIYKPFLAPPIPLEDRDLPTVSKPVLQSEAIAVLQNFLPEYGHILYDAGNCSAAALHLTKVPQGASSTVALGMGGMGYAIAGAIGAQLGSTPDIRTVVFAGDGAFLMTGLEIHTAVDLKLPILFVVFNNNMHGMCAMRQQLYFESRLECVRYAPVDISLIARGFGCQEQIWIGKASTIDELHYQLELYQNHLDIPGILEICLFQEEFPPFTPFLPDNVTLLPFDKYI